jgi:hypothetical protein
MSPLHTAAVLAIVLTTAALLAGFKPAYRAAPATAIILLLIPANVDGTLARRFFDARSRNWQHRRIAVALLSPRVHATFAEAAGRSVTAMSELSKYSFQGNPRRDRAKGNPGLHDNIRSSINQAESAADEVLHERRAVLTTAPDPQPICRTIRRIRNDLAMIGRITSERFPDWIQEELSGSGQIAGSTLTEFLADSGTTISRRQPAPSFANCAREMKASQLSISNLRRVERARELSDEDVGRLFGFVFTLEQLNQNLKDLVDRIAEIAAAHE